MLPHIISTESSSSSSALAFRSDGEVRSPIILLRRARASARSLRNDTGRIQARLKITSEYPLPIRGPVRSRMRAWAGYAAASLSRRGVVYSPGW